MMPPPLLLAGDWLTGGMAVLADEQNLVELNAALRRWLNVSDQETMTAAEFWKALWTRSATWQEPLNRLLREPGSFAVVDLPMETEAKSRPWFQFKVARSRNSCFLGIDSILPPLDELEEAAEGESVDSPAARREVWVRLLRTEGQLNNLVQRWPGVIFSQKADLSFYFVSPRIEEVTGIPAADWLQLPQRFWDVVHEGDANELQLQLKRSAETTGVVTSLFRVRHRQTGRVSYILEQREAARTQHGLLLGFDGFWLDVTRQTIAERRLSSAAWKETLSVLTMGLAHDFSNIMAGIHSLSETFQAQLDPKHGFYEGLGLIRQSSLQASQLVQRILSLHRGKIGERTYHSLKDLVSEVLELVRKIVPRQIRVETEIPDVSWPVYADAVEFRQVLINLAINAADAMPQGGRLRFALTRHESFPELMHVQGTLPRLPCLCVSTEDQGCGIPTQHLASIFDPFFTTKSSDKGSGLGLYNARLFAEKHQGAISVDSIEKRGTTIRVWLPEADFTEAESEVAPATIERRTIVIFGPAGAVLDRMTECLRADGFSAVPASPPKKPSELLQRRDYTASAVLLLVNGADPCFRDLAEAARATGAPLKVIVQITGCNEDEIDSELLAKADLLLPIGAPRAEITTRIRSLWSSL